MEISLTNFQKDLGTVSAEIETLQARSTALNTKLENRQVVEKLLGPAVEEISIAPTVVKRIAEGPIDHAWVKSLEELEKRSRAIDHKFKGPDKILAVSDLKPLLDDLINLVATPHLPTFISSLICSCRQSNEYVTSSSLRSSLYVPRASMRKSSNKRPFSLTGIYTLFSPSIMLNWQRRLVRRISILCAGTI